MILDSAIYIDGRRAISLKPDEALERCVGNEGFAWITLQDPGSEELASIVRNFDLPEIVTREISKTHQRPKLQRIGETSFVALKSARYLEKPEAVELGEIHLCIGANFIIVIRYSEASSPGDIRKQLEGKPDLLRHGPTSILSTILERVVEGYEPVIEGLGNDIDEIEDEVFGGRPDARRIYKLSREVLQFHRAVSPLSRMLEQLTGEGHRKIDPDVAHHLRTVHDQALRTSEQTEGFRELLSNILNVNLNLVSVQQNEQVQKISAWAAILIIPTIITGVYGMNFRYMPELNWLLGYPFALFLMVGISGLLYLWFKRSGWL